MQWQEEFSVGIPEIDQQHMVLVDCITLVEEAVAQPRAKHKWSAINAALGRLADYARMHFAVEESLQRIDEYPEFETHVAEHRRFSFELNQLHEKSLKADISGEMVAFLREWLRSHVMGSDKAWAGWMLRARATRKSWSTSGSR